MRVKAEKRNSIIYCMIGVLICILILLIAFSKSKIYPFGDNTLIYNDCIYQYYDLMGWFRNVLHGKDGLFYTFNIGMGTGTISTIAYYLASPFNILLLFANNTNLVAVITIIIVLKIVACVPTSYFYLTHRFNLKKQYAMLLSVAYSMMEYNVLNNSNLMWLDAVIILPIVSLGIFELINYRKTKMYFFALMFAVLFTYYTGYMICIFAVCYFTLEEVILAMDKKRTIKEIRSELIRFVVVSILACLATSVLLIPNIIQTVKGGSIKPGFSMGLITFKFYNGFRDLFLNGNKLTGSGDSPAIFVGSLSLVLLSGILLPKRIELKKRILIVATLIVGMMAYYITPINYAFSMFCVPNSHYFRHSFIYSFLIIMMAGYYLENARGRRWDYLLGGMMISILAIVVILLSNNKTLLWSTAIPAFIGLAMELNANTKNGVFAVTTLALISLGMIVEHSADWLMELSDHNYSYNSIVSYDTMLSDKIAAIKEDDGNYRIDKTGTRFNDFDRSECNLESSSAGYSSISSYLSTRIENTGRFMNAMGYSGDHKIELYDCVQPIDSILGVKYILSRSMPEGYELISKDDNGVGTYLNRNALPIAFKYTSDFTPDDINPFSNHRKLLNSIKPDSGEMYVEPEVLTVDSDELSYRQWNLMANADGPMYCYVINGDDRITVNIDNLKTVTNVWYSNQIIYMGDYTKGEVASVTINSSDINNYYLAASSVDEKIMETTFSDLLNNSCTVNNMSNGRLEFEYNADEDESIMVTVPYESSWEAIINDNEVQCNRVADTFISLDVTAGHNNIVLEYHPKGLVLGIILSIMAVAVYGVYEIAEKKKRVA